MCSVHIIIFAILQQSIGVDLPCNKRIYLYIFFTANNGTETIFLQLNYESINTNEVYLEISLLDILNDSCVRGKVG